MIFRSRLSNITYYFRSASPATFRNHLLETNDPRRIEALQGHPHYGRDITVVSLDVEDGTHTCPECGRSFGSLNALNAHQGRTGHRGDE